MCCAARSSRHECPAFGKECTPRHPLGATMVSSEGACAAYFNYGRFLSAEELAAAGRSGCECADTQVGTPDLFKLELPAAAGGLSRRS